MKKRGPFKRAFRIALVVGGVVAGIFAIIIAVFFYGSGGILPPPSPNELAEGIALSFAYSFLATFLLLGLWFYFWTLEE